jgi:hypothetical protein
MVLTAYFALSPVIGFLVTVIRRMNSANLTPASRRQDHTTSPSASTAVRLQRAASTASRANVRDDRETPLCGRDGSDIDLIWANREAIYFRLDRANQLDPVEEISRTAHAADWPKGSARSGFRRAT